MGYTILLRDLLAPVAEVMLNRTLGDPARNLIVSGLVVLVRLLPCLLSPFVVDVLRAASLNFGRAEVAT